MIFLPKNSHEGQGQCGGHQLGGGGGDPDAVHAENQREGKHKACLKDQGPEKGDEGGDEAVVLGGEEARAKDGKACKRKTKEKIWKA